jgi:hypothetical protein
MISAVAEVIFGGSAVNFLSGNKVGPRESDVGHGAALEYLRSRLVANMPHSHYEFIGLTSSTELFLRIGR